MPKLAKFFVGTVTVAALVAVAVEIAAATWQHTAQFALLLTLTLIASRLKVKLPGVESNLSVSLPFILLAAVHLGTGEAMVIALLATSVQSLSSPMNARKFTQAQFNCATIMLATAAAQYASSATNHLIGSTSMAVVAASIAYLAVNVGLVGSVIGLAEERSLISSVVQVFSLTFPQFVVAAGIVNFFAYTDKLSWPGVVAALAVLVLVYISYRRIFAELTKSTEALPRLANAVAAH